MQQWLPGIVIDPKITKSRASNHNWTLLSMYKYLKLEWTVQDSNL